MELTIYVMQKEQERKVEQVFQKYIKSYGAVSESSTGHFREQILKRTNYIYFKFLSIDNTLIKFTMKTKLKIYVFTYLFEGSKLVKKGERLIQKV